MTYFLYNFLLIINIIYLSLHLALKSSRINSALQVIKNLEQKLVYINVITIIINVFGLFLANFYPLLRPENTSYYYILDITVIIFVIYKLIYSKYALEQSFRSFFYFYWGIIIITLMLLATFRIIRGIPNPIYVENLAQSSIIRYFMFLIITITGIILFCILKITKKPLLNDLYLKMNSLYFYEEITKILRIFEDEIFGPFFSWVLEHLYKSKLKKILFFALHFFLCYIIGLIRAAFFLNFALFHGDLRLLLYLVPLSLITFIFKVLWYYFKSFIEINGEAIRQEIIVTVPYEDPSILEIKGNLVAINTDFLQVVLKKTSENAIFDAILAEDFKHSFCVLGTMSASISRYTLYTKYLPYVLFSFHFVSWLYIVFCFCNSNLNSIFSFSFFISKSSQKIGAQTSVCRNYATESFYIKKDSQKNLEKVTKGAYRKNHYVTTDPEKITQDKKVPFYNQLTHGKGSTENPSRPLSSDVDVKGNNRPQNAVYTPEKNIV